MYLVLYGSVTGNAADLAESLYDELRRRKLSNVQCKPMGRSSISELQAASDVFIICSTTGQGALPPNTQPLWQQLLRRSLTAPLLSNVRLYSFGLGSTAYPRYNWATHKIHSRFMQLGASQGVHRGEGDERSSDPPYEEVFEQWMRMALSAFDSAQQITDIITAETLLPPVFPLQIGSELTPPPSPTVHSRNVHLIRAQVVENARITAEDHFQDVRKLRLGMKIPIEPDDGVKHGGKDGVRDGLVFAPGDVLCLYPANDDAIVDAVLRAQSWEAAADRSINVPQSYLDAGHASGGLHSPLTLRTLLKWHIDLNAIPRRKFFALGKHFCSKPQHAERMEEFASDLDDLFNYTTRPRRSVAEVIDEFDSLQIPTDYVLDLLPPLRARQFSIASSAPTGKELQHANEELELDLAVAIVKYRTALRRIRRGTCTHWIEQLRPGDEIRVSFERNYLKLANRVAGRPVILVATGTGIAPIRSLLNSIGTTMTSSASSRPYLFFGCRSQSADFLFGNELKQFAKVIPAFSREGGGYVQQQIKLHSKELAIEDAFIFVCGSSGAMPRAVREAFLEGLVDKGLSETEAEKIISSKEKNGDYMQETW